MGSLSLLHSVFHPESDAANNNVYAVLQPGMRGFIHLVARVCVTEQDYLIR